MADETQNNAWGGRTPSPRRDDEPRDDYHMQSANIPTGPARNQDSDENQGQNLHVSGLAMKTTDEDLEDIFGKFGKIKKASIMRDPHSKESRGFGFVDFERADDAEAAMAALHATTLDDKTIGVAKARRGRARTPTPGQYHGPAKARGGPPPYNRPYEPRRDDRYGGPPPPRRDYDRRGPPPPGPYGSYAQPMRGDDRRGGGYGGGYDDRRAPAYDDRRGGGYDDRRAYDDRRIDSRYDDRRSGYDDRRGGPPADYGRRDRDYDDRRRDPRDEPRRY